MNPAPYKATECCGRSYFVKTSSRLPARRKMSLGNAVLLAVVFTVLCLCVLDVSAKGLLAGRYALPEEEPTAKRRLSMIDMLRNPYESFDDVARQDWRTAVQGYFDVMNKIGKTKNNRSTISQSPDSYIKRYT